MTVIRAGVVTAAIPILIAAPVRRLSLLNPVGARLDRQVITLLIRPRLMIVCTLWPTLPAAITTLIGQHLAADAHKEHANCSQTPDAQFHAVSH